MFTYRMLLARKYRDEVNEGGEGAPADTTSVKTDESTGTGDATGAETNSEESVSLLTDDEATDESQNDSDAGKEGAENTPLDTYADFVMPEGMQLDTAALEQAAPLFKDLGLTQEQAQKVIDLYAQQVQAGSQKQIDDFNQLKNDWLTKTQNDKEYGGDKFDENVKVARAAINTYGTPELKQLLEDYGMGNHPEVVRFMVRVGRTLKEDVPGSSGVSSSTAQDRVTQMYPNQSKT